METTGTYVDNKCIAITHKNRPFKGTTYRIATPTVKDMYKASIGHLWGTLMRIVDNTLHRGSAMGAILQYCYEAKYGANFSKEMIKKAYKKFSTHPRYIKDFKKTRGIMKEIFKD